METKVLSVHTIGFASDATNQEAVEHSKVHGGLLQVVTTGAADAAKLVVDGAVTPCTSAKFVQMLPDIQKVHAGTGEETYNTILKEFQTSNVETWLDRLTAEGLLTMYVFPLDHGPDNNGCMHRIKRAISGVLLVMVLVVWCFMHQSQLIIKAMLQVLDTFEWTESTDIPVSYFSGIATTANTWRSTGVPRKVQDLSAEIFDDATASNMKKVPGRCLRGRWMASDSVEYLLDKFGMFLGVIFGKMFGIGGDNEVKTVTKKKETADGCGRRR